MTSPERMAQHFALPPVRTVQPVGCGLTHQTYRVITTAGDFVLQRLHTAIPDAALTDMLVVTNYLASCGLLVPSLRLTLDGAPYARDEQGKRWRVYPWLPGQVLEAVPHAALAHEAGRLVGQMHRHLARLDYTPQGSVPHFHDTAFIVAELHSVHDQLPADTRAMAADLLATLPALIDTEAPQQLIHGDLKISNLLFNDAGQAVGLLDFDTVLRQARAIDLGDALRSWCNRTTEDDPQACFDRTFHMAAVNGYAEGMQRGLRPAEQDNYLRATRQITGALAARFLIDVVRDSYFGFDPTRYPSRRAHNLARARAQYHLAQTIPASVVMGAL